MSFALEIKSVKGDKFPIRVSENTTVLILII